MGRFPSGQRGQTVNLLATPSVVRIHLCPFARDARIGQSVGWCGGIGRRKGLKIPREQSRAGSSPATSSILWIAETLNLSVFPLFFCLLGVRVETCKMFTRFYTYLEWCKIVDLECLQCACGANTPILNIQSSFQFLPFWLVRVPREAVVIYKGPYVPVSGKFHSVF